MDQSNCTGPGGGERGGRFVCGRVSTSQVELNTVEKGEASDYERANKKGTTS